MASNTEKDKNKPKLMLRIQAPLDECQLFSYRSFMLLWNTSAYEAHGPHAFYCWLGAAKFYEDV